MAPTFAFHRDYFVIQMCAQCIVTSQDLIGQRSMKTRYTELAPPII